MAWKKVAEKNEIPEGKGKEFVVDGKHIAIFNQTDYMVLTPYVYTKTVHLRQAN